MKEFLRNVPLFAGLSDADLGRVCDVGEEVRLGPGEVLFSEGDQGDSAYVIREGELEIVKNSDQREVLIAVRGSGAVIGEMALLEEAPRMATVRARTECSLVVIRQHQLEQLLDSSPTVARSLLHIVTSRLRGTGARLRMSEKMAQLGTLTAGLAHELNNPAAAVQRGVEHLNEADRRRLAAELMIARSGLDERQHEVLRAKLEEAGGAATKSSEIDGLERNDREEAVEALLEEYEVPEPWEVAPALVDAGIGPDEIQNLGSEFEERQIGAVLCWLASQVAYLNVLDEVLQGARRISELVKSLKVYSYLDQAPIQNVDVHEGLDSTLVLLRSKLKAGVNVKRDYAPDLPKITAYGSELNQVWTNLIDNAVDAMDGTGDLEVKTSLLEGGGWVSVQIADSGPGIPEEVRGKIFDAFFTTKPPGKGTGLGLDISYNIVVNRHRGEITVASRPGRTVFEVRLPLDCQVDTGDAPSSYRPSDETLRGILTSKGAVAVVGISSREGAPGNSIPAYLQKAGYDIVPVNPGQDEILGRKSYPDLRSVPETPHIVLIFRRSDLVGPIVDEAIEVGARVIWMQEGIVDEAAAERASDAGLEVVMDTCMMATHRRLFGGE